ncbi:citramalate synthase [bacterium]|nr:citramalate synthase [bacterium]
MKKIFIYDTTLRDGSQAEGVNFSVEDKVEIAKELDMLGIDYVEGGWPGSNPKDIEFFEKIKKVSLKNIKVSAFGSTRRAGVKASEDANLRLLIEAQTPAVAIFGKSWDLHVKDVLRVSLKENLEMISSSVEFLKKNKREVIYDAEHFFDGYKSNPEYALQTIQAAADAGADCLALCDTNGGTIPSEISRIISEIKDKVSASIGIHCHNDGGLAVGNSLSAVEAGAVHVQGTMNGYGERCGNANLCAIIPNLELKMDKKVIGKSGLKKLVDVSYYVSELANMVPDNRQPFVGYSAFAHKGGMHVNAVEKNPVTFEHIDPSLVGNHRRILISELSGKSNIILKSKELNIDLDENSPKIKDILKEIKELENEGYEFEAAEASFNLLIQKVLGKHKPFFELLDYRVLVEKKSDDGLISEATVRMKIKGNEEYVAAEGDGPVNALDSAVRKALVKYYPKLNEMYLVDYKVRVLNAKEATAAKVRVWIRSSDETETWSTVGVSENIVEASWIALIDSVEYKLMKH